MSKCTIDDIRWIGQATKYFSIDKAGEPDYNVETIDADFQTYTCMSESHAPDYPEFATWDEVQKHLEQ